MPAAGRANTLYIEASPDLFPCLFQRRFARGRVSGCPAVWPACCSVAALTAVDASRSKLASPAASRRPAASRLHACSLRIRQDTASGQHGAQRYQVFGESGRGLSASKQTAGRRRQTERPTRTRRRWTTPTRNRGSELEGTYSPRHTRHIGVCEIRLCMYTLSMTVAFWIAFLGGSSVTTTAFWVVSAGAAVYGWDCAVRYDARYTR